MKKIEKWPKVTFVFPTLNGGKGVKMCLDSVMKQDYSKDKIEIIVMDNGSKDNSVTIAKKYTKKVYVDAVHDGFITRANGMRKATGEFVFMILEQDLELARTDFIKNMVKPLIENNKIVASFTRDCPRKDQPWVTRFISYDPIQRDPFFEFLTPSIQDTFVKEMEGYSICKLTVKKLPPVTHMLFRVSALKQTSVWKQKRDFDHDTVIGIIKGGFTKFAYVPKAGTYHHHAKDLKQLLNKRKRNLNNHFFPYNNSTEYKWMDLSKRKNVLKLIFWVIYANLFIPALLRGMYRAVKFRDWVLLLEPVITIATTDVILMTFLKHETGRMIIMNSIKSLAGIR